MNTTTTLIDADQEFLVRKAGKWFSVFDADRDALIDRADFAATAGRLSAALGLPADDELAAEVRETLLAVWDAIAPRDAVATPDDLGRVLGALLADPGHPAFGPLLQMIEVTFRLLDINGDGYAGGHAVVALLGEGFGTPAADAFAAFRSADQDDDHLITRDDWARLTLEYWGGGRR